MPPPGKVAHTCFPLESHEDVMCPAAINTISAEEGNKIIGVEAGLNAGIPLKKCLDILLELLP